MGHDKALLARHGQTQLDYLVQVLQQSLQDVFVSTRSDQKDDKERSRYRQIVDRYDDMGPLAGILSALEASPEADWLVVACDLPNIDQATIENLLQQHDAEYPFTAYVSSHDGLPEPLCAVYHQTATDIIRSYVSDGIYCPRKILIRSDTQLLQQPDPRSLDNINTPDDLRDSILEAN
jgi:molybdopterin-guanine dinucleotide biosynthesis protein A